MGDRINVRLSPSAPSTKSTRQAAVCLEQDRVDLARDRHVDSVAPREPERRLRVGTPSATISMPPRIASSCSPRPILSPTARLRPWRENAVVIRSPIPASPVNVAGLPPSDLREPGDLDQPARDERGLGVVAETEAVDDAGRDRDHVLERARELDAERVGVRVDAEALRGQRALEAAGERVATSTRSRPTRGSGARPPPRGSDPRGPRSRGFGESSRRTWLGRSWRPISMPFESERMPLARADARRGAARRRSRTHWVGTALTIVSAPASACAGSREKRSASGSRTPGR